MIHDGRHTVFRGQVSGGPKPFTIDPIDGSKDTSRDDDEKE